MCEDVAKQPKNNLRGDMGRAREHNSTTDGWRGACLAERGPEIQFPIFLPGDEELKTACRIKAETLADVKKTREE